MGTEWIGKSINRKEDPRLLTGKGTFVDNIKIPNMKHAAILRSPYAHAKILNIDYSESIKIPGVRSVLTGGDVAKMSRPFPKGVTAPIKYYSLAVDKARFVGEPVAVVIADNRYIAEDALDVINVDYEPLASVVDIERALERDAPILHEEIGSNIANHRFLRYGDVEKAFKEADSIVKAKFSFPKYSSTPLETFAVIADFNPVTGIMTIWSNFQGPFIMHPVVAMALDIPDNKLRFIIPPDIGGGYGIKTSIYPYMALIALATKKSGFPVKWIEDRREHLLASSSGTDRISYYEAAVKKDGAILAVKSKVMDNVGGYIRTPEPACLYRTTGNTSGAYKYQALDIDAYAVMTNKSLTGPNRGYGCQQLYFSLERLVDIVAKELKMDPVEIRMKNLIQPEQFPYTTPTGGIYDSGDYPEALKKALGLFGYDKMREEQKRARAEGRIMGIGVATVVDPSVTNIGYITVAKTPEERAKELPKSGSGETAVIKIDPLGNITAMINTLPQGQGHETIVAQIIANELGVPPEDVNVVAEMDTFTRFWSITTGSYSSRFASVTTSATAIAARRLKEKMIKIAAHNLEVSEEDLEFKDGKVFVRGLPDKSLSIKRIAGIAHWNQQALPEGMEPGLYAICIFNFPTAKSPDEKDRVDSSNTYGFIADVIAVEIDPDTGQVKILKYVSVHDCGTVIHPNIVEGQVYGSAAHGIGGALYEDMVYDENGQYLAATFADYLVPTTMEVPDIKIDHVVSPSPFTVLGSKGCGESNTESTPAVIGNAVADALSIFGIDVNELPLTPDKIWRMLREAREKKR